MVAGSSCRMLAASLKLPYHTSSHHIHVSRTKNNSPMTAFSMLAYLAIGQR